MFEHKQKAIDLDIERGSQSVVTEEQEFQNRDESIHRTFRAFLLHQDSMVRKKINDSHSNIPKK